MRQNVRTITIFAALYAMFAAVALVPLFGTGGLNDATFGIGMVLAIALIPVTAIILTVVPPIRRHAPAVERPLPARRPASAADERDHFDFAFAAWNGIESAEAVARLSRRLHALEIVHRFEDGEISVADGDVRWKVAPVVGALRIAGWVEAPTRETRAMIEAAIEEFLIEELGIRLEKLAA